MYLEVTVMYQDNASEEADRTWYSGRERVEDVKNQLRTHD